MTETEIVVLTTEESPVFAQQALEAGAVGYVLKDNVDGELPQAIVERRLNPAWETVFVPFVAGMALAVVAGFARS